MRSFPLTVFLIMATLAPILAASDDTLDQKYPQLAALRFSHDRLPSGVTPIQLDHQPQHEHLKAFEVTEEKANFGVNGMTRQLLMHDRISAFYMGTYQAETVDGGKALFGIHAWQYKDETSAQSNVAEFAGAAVGKIMQVTDSAEEARQALASMKYFHDGRIVVALTMEAGANTQSRIDFEKLVRSRLTSKHIEVPIDGIEVEGSSPSAKPKSFDENGAEMRQQVARIRKRWKKDFNKANSPQARTVLSKNILEEARRATSGSLQQFALGFTSVMLAVEATDVELAVTGFDFIDQHFQTDGERARISLAAAACEQRTTPLSPEQQKRVLKLCDRAILLDEFFAAKSLLQAVKLSSDKQTQAQVRLLEERILAEQPDIERGNDPGAGPTLVVEREDGPMLGEQPMRQQEPVRVQQPLPDRRRPAVADNPFVMANGETVRLPAAFEDVIVGGAGRFLFFQMGTLKKLAVFDVSEQKIVHELPLEEADSRIVAGAEHLYIAVRRENVIQRWSLDGFEKELTVKLPFRSPVEEIATGSHVTGVIYAGSADDNGVLLSPRTLQPANLRIIDHTGRKPADPLPGAERTIVRASENGRTFCLLCTRYSPGDFRTLVVIDDFVHSFRRGESVSYMTPNSTGELIYTPKGIFTDQAKEFRLSDGLFAKRFQMPAIGSSYSVSVDREDRKKEESATVNLHIGSAAEPMISLPDLTLRPGEYGDFHAQSRLTLDRRVFFFPDADLLVTLPTSNDLLVLTDLDVDQELRQNGEEYLLVVSRPPQYVQKGSRFEYQIEVKSTDDEPELTLESGPPGMRLTDDGMISWRVPRKSGEPFDAVITVKSSSGKETTHAFRLTVID